LFDVKEHQLKHSTLYAWAPPPCHALAAHRGNTVSLELAGLLGEGI